MDIRSCEMSKKAMVVPEIIYSDSDSFSVCHVQDT